MRHRHETSRVFWGLVAVWAALFLLGLLVGCNTPPPRILTEVQTVETLVEVPVPCPIPQVFHVEGPDLAPTDFGDWETAQFIEVRILAMRREIDALRRHAEVCAE